MSSLLKARGIAHSFVGHPSMSGLYFAKDPPRNYRDWKGSDYSFYDAAAKVLHDEKILCEPDSREPWFVSAAHDESCLTETLAAFEIAIDTTMVDVAARINSAAKSCGGAEVLCRRQKASFLPAAPADAPSAPGPNLR
jgi:glutamate-1-semialdehyde 2,1-aminomutase